MSKARTLADFISDGSEFADGTISVAEVSGAAPLASPTFTGNVSLGDNVQIRLGDSSDLQIYHDGSASYVDDQGEGPLKIKATDFRIKNAADTKNYLRADDGGAVSIYYDNSLKLATATDGVDITGDVGATTATITGKTTTDELDLNAISATISDTAVDIFVYDTRKDSDGGAWRKRTQHTSWYNETLNTSTRGSRKEFPAVAVIVAESTQVTIYDGDDPDMPMWMVFNAPDTDPATYAIVKSSGQSISSATALNGTIATSVSFNGLFYQNFVSDDCFRVNTTNTIQGGNIYSRNGGMSFSNTVGTDGLVNATVNDVAMTVLPNAPIDAATGLPVPTIAVATDGGVSVIKDNGTIVDITNTNGSYNYAETVKFTADYKMIIDFSYLSTDNNITHVVDIPTSDYSQNFVNFQATGLNGRYYHYDSSIPNLSLAGVFRPAIAPKQIDEFAMGGSLGLNFISEEPQTVSGITSDAMVAYTTSDYNTGWMNGDIKLATLSDTDATNVTGSELVTNGTFDTDTSGWTGAFSNISVTGGTLQVVGTANFNYATQTVTGLTVGKKYVFQADIVTGSGNTYIYVRRGDNGGGITNGSANGVGSYALTFEAPTTSVEIRLYQIYQTTSTFDNVSLRLAEEDRSVNGNGLQVFGTVTKSAVATGADLVAYSNWGLSSYLMQPPNADIAVNSDRTFVTWFKTSYTGNFSYLFSITGSSRAYGLAVTLTDGYLYAYDNVNNTDTTSTAVADGNWHCAALVHSGGYKKLYVDGNLAGTFAASDVTFDSDANLYLGLYKPVGGSFNYNLSGGSMALFRMSHTAASPEQIKKIYEDEKVLFQENAQATLYGSSDAVTALAYDDSTNLLHVGTSAGRSVFQGLRRVDNTTTAVGAAISASNGLVADE